MAGSTGAAAVYGRTEMMRELNADLCAAGCVLAFKLMVLLQLQALPAQETVPFCRDSAMPTRDTGCHSSQASGRHRDVLQDHRRVVGHVKRGAPSWLLCLHSEMMPGCFWTLDSRLVSWGHDIRRGLQQEPAGSAGKHLRVTLSSIFAIRDIRDVEVSCWRGALADFVGQRRAARANFVHLFVPRARSRIYFTTGNAPCPLGSQQSSQLAGLRVLCFRFELARVLDSSSH